MLHVREYGDSGPHIIVLHGGPGASWHMAPPAREWAIVLIAGSNRSGEAVANRDSRSQGTWRTCMRSSTSTQNVAVLPSWALSGARCLRSRTLLAPGAAESLILVGCGAFDLAARAKLRTDIAERMNDEFRARPIARINSMKTNA
jgi:hypothetical protein